MVYDEENISLNEILDKFWDIIDPTVLNRVGNDTGRQYRTGIYFYDDEDEEIIMNSLMIEQKKYKDKIVTEVLPVANFYKAEEYHQNYLKKNPRGYCHIQFD